MSSLKFPVERARALLERLIPEDGSVAARRVHRAAKRAGLPEWAIRKAQKGQALEVRG